MPEQVKPEETRPFFEIKGDKIIIDGTEMHISEFDETWQPTEEGGENATLEGTEFKEPEEKVEEEEKDRPRDEKGRFVKAEEPEAEPEKPEKQEEQPVEEVPPKTPEQTVPERMKFKLKFRGEESEVELTPEQIANRLQILRSYQENEKEFWENKKKVDVHARIIDSDPYKEWIRERQEQGEPVPGDSAPSQEEELIRYEIEKRRDPEVIVQLREWAMDNLTPEQIHILDTNPKVFMSEYDKIAEQVKKAKEPPKPPEPKVDPKVKEQILKSKEVSKARAAVERPGVKTEVDPDASMKRRVKQLERMMREGNRGQQEQAAEELAYIKYFKSYGVD